MQKILAILGAAALSACASWPTVPALRETAAVAATGDAADDPAIWVAPDPGDSLVVATQKQGGLYIFDLSGAIVQEAPGGRPNNVDLRDDFNWSEGPSPIVGASDRTDNTIVLWRFDAAARRLDPMPRARIPTGFREVYGFCIGRMDRHYVALATDRDSGEVGLWRLQTDADAGISAERIASYTLGSIAEGCVIDDDAGAYYLAQELEGVWRVDLDDATGASRRLIDRVGGGGNLVADVEGLALWRRSDGAGYLIASVQGNSTFAVYRRDGANEYLGAFRVGSSADGAADAVQGTDGVDVTSTPLSVDLPQGLVVVQDDRNTNPRDLQNFKYVSWEDVAAALGLP
jgi:3-phytase